MDANFLRNPRKIQLHYPMDNFYAAARFLHAPPSFLSHSYPPYSPQPPLLPLPPATSRRSSAVRGSSCPPSRKPSNGCRNRDSSLTPKKSNPNRKIQHKKSPEKIPTVSSVRSLPVDLSANCDDTIKLRSESKPAEDEILDDKKFSGSVAFTVSPPPSSLPLPTFSLRPKLACSAEAAGIDAGATDNLRRLLRLR